MIRSANDAVATIEERSADKKSGGSLDWGRTAAISRTTVAPRDGRAKLVLPTDKGREVVSIAQSLVPELEKRLI